MGAVENKITKAVKDFLNRHGGKMVRVQSGCIKVQTRFIRGAEAGTADLIGTFRGYPLAVECKTPIGKQSQTQQDWEHEWRGCGGLYCLAKSVDDVRWLLDLPDRR